MKAGECMNFDDLNAEMARKRLSIPLLAKKIGISKKTLYSRMRGETPFNQIEISTISNILNLSDSQILSIFFADTVA